MSLTPRTHRTEAIVQTNGSGNLEKAPFAPGETVEVIVMSRPQSPPGDRRPLRGKLIHYDRPLEPVAEDDWEAHS